MKKIWLHAPIGLLAGIIALVPAQASTDSNPLKFLSGGYTKYTLDRMKTNKITAKPEKKAKKPTFRRRSLARYAQMKNEYLGPLHTSEAVKSTFDASVYTRHVPTGNPYLDMKAIDGPLPQDYSTLYLKSKTLLSPTEHKLKIVIDQSEQRIFVYKDLEQLYTFKSSTGVARYRTPNGTFKPQWMSRMHYSIKYHYSPMPWSTFFNGGVAIHGTDYIWRLGHAASHGCIRTHPVSARRIFNLIRRYGKKNTTIIVQR